MVSKDERLMAALIYIVSFFTAFIGPLLIWLFHMPFMGLLQDC